MLLKGINFKTLRHNLRFFSNTPATPGAPNPNAPAIKTKEQLKLEALMEQLPEQIKNPEKDTRMQLNKEKIMNLYKFNQEDKKSVQPWDIPVEILQEMTYKMGAMTSDNITDFLVKHEGYVPDTYFLQLFQRMTIVYPDITQDFYDVVLPKLKKMMLGADRHTISVIAIGAIGCGKNSIADAELWEIVVRKMNHSV